MGVPQRDVYVMEVGKLYSTERIVFPIVMNGFDLKTEVIKIYIWNIDDIPNRGKTYYYFLWRDNEERWSDDTRRLISEKENGRPHPGYKDFVKNLKPLDVNPILLNKMKISAENKLEEGFFTGF